MKLKDNRMKMMNELLTGMKVCIHIASELNHMCSCFKWCSNLADLTGRRVMSTVLQYCLTCFHQNRFQLIKCIIIGYATTVVEM
jgi:hypothetical protein